MLKRVTEVFENPKQSEPAVGRQETTRQDWTGNFGEQFTSLEENAIRKLSTTEITIVLYTYNEILRVLLIRYFFQY